MAWKSYALASGSIGNAAQCAEIITEELGECTFDSSNSTFTYSYGGEMYTVKCIAEKTANQILFLNKETGEFILSYSDSMTLSSSTSMGAVLLCAILMIHKADGTIGLSPLAHFNGNAATRYFSIPDVSQGLNSSANIVLVPMVTNAKYSNASDKVNVIYRPVINMFTGAIQGIAVGNTIQVDGQNFLCVAPTMFEKL